VHHWLLTVTYENWFFDGKFPEQKWLGHFMDVCPLVTVAVVYV
jgi:hypothetical protein